MSLIRILILISIFININSITFTFSLGNLFDELQKLLVQSLYKNPYRTLNIPPWTSMKKIKKRYNELVKKYHPDRSETGNREEFEIIQQAFEMIKKERKEKEENENLSLSDVIKITISKILNIEIIFGLVYTASYLVYKFQKLIYVQLFYMVISFTIIDNLFAHFFSGTLIKYIICLAIGWFLYTRHNKYFQEKSK